MTGVAAGGAGVVAVGGLLDGDTAAVWTSPDGVTWTRILSDEAVFGGPGSQVMWGVAAFGAGVVAVGLDDAAGDAVAAVWVALSG
jgi:hypothetical protein